MFIDPRVAISEGWIKGIKDEDKQVQPNAIDFTLDKLFMINDDTEFSISESGKQMRMSKDYPAILDRREQMMYWKLQPHQCYDGMSDVYVDVPEGVAVLPLIIRSTFNRNGIFITSGLYDSGYKGHLGFIIHNRSGVANIATGTRIGQIAFVESVTAKMYAGGWNHTEGTHYTEEGDNK